METVSLTITFNENRAFNGFYADMVLILICCYLILKEGGWGEMQAGSPWAQCSRIMTYELQDLDVLDPTKHPLKPKSLFPPTYSTFCCFFKTIERACA